MAALWALGAIINVIGSVLINLGTNVIKLGHTRTASHHHSTTAAAAASSKGGKAAAPRALRHPRRWWRYPGNRVWLAGMSLFTVGNLLNFASFAFAAQSLLSALGVVQFISNIIFGRFVNKEKVTKRVLFATAVVCTGCVLLVSFGNHESPTLSTHGMLALYSQPLYITYLCLIFTASPLFYAAYRSGKRAILADAAGGTAARRWARWLPVCYALFAGPLGTQSVLYGKTISMLLRTTFSGDNQLDHWYTWVSLLLFLLSAGFWMSRYSKAMKLFPVLIIMPIIQIVWILFSMISGSIYFQEYKTLDALSGSMFALGVVVELVGVWILTGGQQTQTQAQPPASETKLGPPSESGRTQDDEAALRSSKLRLSEGSEVELSPSALLEPEEQLVARKLSNVYERQQQQAQQAALGGGGGGLGRLSAGRSSRRPGSASRRSLGAAESGSEQLMEEGVRDSAAAEGTATPQGSRRYLPGVGEEDGGSVGGGSAAARAREQTPSTPQTQQEQQQQQQQQAAAASPPSLMHDIRQDWGVGMRDLNAVFRASLGVYQDEADETAFSIWSMPIATGPSFSAAAGPRRHSVDVLGAGPTFRIRSALEAQLVPQGSGIPGGSSLRPSASPHGVTLDDGALGSGGARRPGHRRLNRSRSANELEDILKEAALEHSLQLAEHGGMGGGVGLPGSPGSPWLSGPQGGTPASAAAAAAPAPGSRGIGTPPVATRRGSAPVLLSSGGTVPGSAQRAPMLSTPGSASRRPHGAEAPPSGLPALSPAVSGVSEADVPDAPVREGGLAVDAFLPGDSMGFSPAASASWGGAGEAAGRKRDKAA